MFKKETFRTGSDRLCRKLSEIAVDHGNPTRERGINGEKAATLAHASGYDFRSPKAFLHSRSDPFFKHVLSIGMTLLVLAFSAVCAPANAASDSNEAGRRKKILIFGVDGLRPDALKAAQTPHFDRLIADGAFSDQAQTGKVTKSAPGWASMLTGVWPRKHGVTSNDYSATWRGLSRYPAFIERLERLRPELVTASFANWVGINMFLVRDVDHKVQRDTQKLSDEEVIERAVEFLKTNDPDVMFLHFDSVDAAGHAHGFHPTSPEYLKAIETVDARLGTMMQALEERPNRKHEDWLVLSATDHGGKGKVHGPSDPECRTIYVLAHGRGVRKGVIERPPQVGDDSWSRGAIDQFVLARLDEEKLKPAPEADRYTLIRRLSLDLTGLPPTIDEVEQQTMGGGAEAAAEAA